MNGKKADIAQEFTRCMDAEDIEGIARLFAEDAEWVLMPSRETFRGRKKIKERVAKSIAARTHSPELGIRPFNIYTNVDETRLYWEYVHTAVATEKWPLSKDRPAPGSKVRIPVVLVCEIRDNQLVKLRAYLDSMAGAEPGVLHYLYS